MACRRLTDRLIKIEDIHEEIRLIKGSKTDYITITGKIYKDYGNNMFFPKKTFVNKYNGYVYTNITYPSGNKQRRVHIILAEAWIPNPNNLPIVMHIDNNKQNNCINNLKWGTISENTKQAVDDGLLINKKGFDDSQSHSVSMYNTLTRELIKIYGSCRICAEENKYNLTLATILNQCKYYAPTRHIVYFRFTEEGNINPPKIIIQYDYDTDKEINKYLNTSDAESKTQISANTISEQCRKGLKPKHKTKSGFYFKYST